MKRSILLNWNNCDGGAPPFTSPPMCPSPTPPWHRPTLTPQTQMLTGDSTLNLGYQITYLVQATAKTPTGSPPVVNPYYITLPPGNYQGQSVSIFIPGYAVGTTSNFLMLATLSGGFRSILFNNASTSAILQWDGTSWNLVGGNGQLSMNTQ